MGGSVLVLHVDDEPGFAELAATFLERADDRLTVEAAADAEEGLDRLADGDVDCVVSDYEMPGADGIEFLEAVRGEYPDLPFVLFTGKGNEEVASEAISAGVTDYLQKGSGTEQYAVLANRITNAVERVRARREAERTRTRLEAITDHANDAIVTIDADGVVRFANPAVEDLFGYAPTELEGEPLTTVMPERHRDAYREAVDRYLATGERSVDWTAVEFRARRRDGSEVPVSISFGEFERDGERRFVGSVRDRSHRVRMEEQLRERGGLFRQVTEDIREVVWISDPRDEEMLYVNPAYEEIWGRPVDDLYDGSTDFLDTVHPGDRDRVERALDAQAAGRYDEVYRIVRPNDEVRWIHDRAVPVEDDGEVVRIVGIASDVTERKEREQRLERYERIVEAIGDPVYALDAEGRFTFVNEMGLSMGGYSADDLLGEHVSTIMDSEAVRRGEELIWDLLTADGDRFGTFETDLATADEEAVPCEIRMTLLPPDEDGSFRGTVGIARDISERRARSRALERERDRLEKFASVVSHDLRNPLTVAADRLTLAREDCDSDHLDPIESSLDRMDALIEDLLALAREGEAVRGPEPVDLAAFARVCWRTVATGDATLAVGVDGDRSVRADRTRLRQLLENLYRNSAEHSSAGSRTESGDAVEHGSPGSRSQAHGNSVEHSSTGSRTESGDSTEDGRPDGRSESDGAADREAGAVTVTVGELADGEGFYVEDDGPGIAEGERDRVFEAGYSTSPDGTGFGLSIVERICEAHGWEVRATESAAGGARFEITGVEFLE